MAAPGTDYGVALQMGDGAPTEVFTTLADVVNLPIPGIENVLANVTAHDSGGYEEHIATGLKKLDEFAITISYDVDDPQQNLAAGLLGKVVSGEVTNFKIVFPTAEEWAFAAIVRKFTPQAANPQSPSQLKAVVTFRPTGTPTLV